MGAGVGLATGAGVATGSGFGVTGLAEWMGVTLTGLDGFSAAAFGVLVS